MPILHLIDGGFRARGPGQIGPANDAFTACALLRRRAPFEQSVALVGPRSIAERAAQLGLSPDLCLTAPLGKPEAAWRTLRTAMDARGLPTIIHCWSAAAATLADRAFAGACPIVATLQSPQPLPPIARVTTLSNAAGDDWARAGVVRGQLLVTPPPVEVASRDRQRREQLRHRMGIAPDAILVGLLGHAPTANAMRFVFFIGLLNVAGVRIVGLASEHAGQAVRGQRMTWSHTAPRVILTSDPMTDMLPACDLAIFDAGGHGPTSTLPPCPSLAVLPIAQAHAAGVPVVAPEWADVAGLYPAAARACLAHNSTIPELARVALPLIDSPGLREQLSHSVHEHIARLDPASGFVEGLCGLWQTLDEPAEILS
jgi:hypothetical protein